MEVFNFRIEQATRKRWNPVIYRASSQMTGLRIHKLSAVAGQKKNKTKDSIGYDLLTQCEHRCVHCANRGRR